MDDANAHTLERAPNDGVHASTFALDWAMLLRSPGSGVEARFAPYQQFMLSQARRLTNRESEVEDLVHDTWLRFWMTPPKIDRCLRPWLIHVMRNRYFELMRNDSRRIWRELKSEPLDEERSPEDLLQLKEQAEELWGCLNLLREPYRCILHLHYRDGLPSKTIAEELGRPHETVRSQIKRGLNALREQLPLGSPV